MPDCRLADARQQRRAAGLEARRVDKGEGRCLHHLGRAATVGGLLRLGGWRAKGSPLPGGAGGQRAGLGMRAPDRGVRPRG